jgi:hypothetical protein
MRFILLLALFATEASWAGKALENVELVFRDSDVKDDYDKNEWNPEFLNLTFNVQPAVDDRKDPAAKAIGFCQDKKVPITTKSDIAAFVTTSVGHIMDQTGIRTSKDSKVKLYLDLRDFFVEEGNMYEGRIQIGYTVVGERGDTLYSKVAFSTSKRWGRSYNLDNYMETLTGALYSNVDEFLKNRTRYSGKNPSR